MSRASRRLRARPSPMPGAESAASRADFEKGRNSRRAAGRAMPGPWSRTRSAYPVALSPRPPGGSACRPPPAAYLQALSTRLNRICSTTDGLASTTASSASPGASTTNSMPAWAARSASRPPIGSTICRTLTGSTAPPAGRVPAGRRPARSPPGASAGRPPAAACRDTLAARARAPCLRPASRCTCGRWSGGCGARGSRPRRRPPAARSAAPRRPAARPRRPPPATCTPQATTSVGVPGCGARLDPRRQRAGQQVGRAGPPAWPPTPLRPAAGGSRSACGNRSSTASSHVRDRRPVQQAALHVLPAADGDPPGQQQAALDPQRRHQHAAASVGPMGCSGQAFRACSMCLP